ncbi:hypothetical protein RMSM_06554 [Rhodopirellula maiorica SM1]|uniref:Uncharacterized protein n=1 Tax=Rhodopirellula maiorica SM1 TaxID=1265738 RepID=M5RAM0_9BACT|nr:hypothetical protein RMSM_06554 [Rhodopirellula maiorica SM1]
MRHLPPTNYWLKMSRVMFLLRNHRGAVPREPIKSPNRPSIRGFRAGNHIRPAKSLVA